jgi:hypothetical protein
LSDGDKSYTYDELDRLLTADSILYAYDLVGNRMERMSEDDNQMISEDNYVVNNLNQVIEN